MDATRAWIERASDRGLRHKTGVTPDDYLEGFLEIGRRFAFASQDDSWGEFEKLFHIMALELYDSRKELAQYQWQPIETAPKDGIELLFYGKSPSGSPEYRLGFWWHNFKCWVFDGGEDLISSEAFIPLKWQLLHQPLGLICPPVLFFPCDFCGKISINCECEDK